jgi:hypothetical protein
MDFSYRHYPDNGLGTLSRGEVANRSALSVTHTTSVQLSLQVVVVWIHSDSKVALQRQSATLAGSTMMLSDREGEVPRAE